MALDYGLTSNEVGHQHGTLGGAKLESGTLGFWFLPDQNSTWDAMLFAKKGGIIKFLQGSGDLDDIALTRYQTGGGNLGLRSDDFSTGIWQFIVFRWVFGGADSLQTIYKGLEGSPPAEVTYLQQSGGSGTPTDPASEDFTVGHAPDPAYNVGFDGKMAWYGLWDDYYMSDHEVYELWKDLNNGFKFHQPDLFVYPGMFGVGAQHDWSGNRYDGTAVGTVTLADNPLLTNFPAVNVVPEPVGIPGYSDNDRFMTVGGNL